MIFGQNICFQLACHNRCHNRPHNRYRLSESSFPLGIGIIGKKRYRHSSNLQYTQLTPYIKFFHNMHSLNTCLYVCACANMYIQLYTSIIIISIYKQHVCRKVNNIVHRQSCSVPGNACMLSLCSLASTSQALLYHFQILSTLDS